MSTTTHTVSILRPTFDLARGLFDSVLASQLRHGSGRAGSRALASPVAPGSAVDMDRLLEMAGHEPNELRYIVGMYLIESERVMDELSASVQAGDWDETQRLAHRLAGTSASCGMAAMVPPLRQLEITARVGRWSRNQALLLEARHQQQRVSACLEGYGLKKGVGTPEAWGKGR